MSSSSSFHPAVASAIRADDSQKTPSWTAIVEAYHREGNNDREMLLALLNAKAKEDERLAALDLLHAEQLRAYTAHITIHGPFSHQLPHHYHSHAQQPHAQYHPQMHAALPTPPLSSTHPRAHANSTSSASSSSGASTSRTSVSSGSSSSRKVTKSTTSTAKKPRQTKSHHQQQQQQQSQQQRDNASRSPSLSHTASESGVSSLDELQTPADERRLSDVSLGLGGGVGTKRKAAAATEADFIEAFSMAPTTAACAMQHYDHQQQHIERPAKRHSPSAAVPSSIEATQQQRAHIQAARQTSPRSLVNILNDDLRPLCLNKYRAATSDLRGSASDEDELA